MDPAPLLTQPVLVVNQKAKLIEVTNEYAVLDAAGTRLGAVRQVGQSTLRKVLRFISNWDQYLTHKFELTDVSGQVLLRMTRPAKIMKSTVIVERPDGAEIGRLVQENVFGKIRFALQVEGRSVGSLNAENWRAWNFVIKDGLGNEVARITKKFGGLVRAAFTTADNYMVTIDPNLPQGPLRSLVIAAAVTVDTALKQDEN